MIQLAILLLLTSCCCSSALQGEEKLSKTLSTRDFCSPLGEDCVGQKCYYYEKCPAGAYPYKCGEKKCARDKSVCEVYLDAESHFNSRYFKTNAKLATLPEQVEKALRKQETQFHTFQSKIENCSKNPYLWKPNDVCLLAKICYEKVKLPYKSVAHWIFAPPKYEMARIECPCDSDHNYKCHKEFCTTSKQACKEFTKINKTKQTIKLDMQWCA